MKAIVTKYHGPTNTKGSRFSATAEGCKRISVPYDYSKTASDNHRAVAEEFCRRMGWVCVFDDGLLVSASLPDGREVHIMTR